MERNISELKESTVKQLLQNWHGIRIELDGRFKKRESQLALPLMKEAIDTFIAFLFAANDLEGSSMAEVARCSIKPVNAVERLDFIMSRPGLYHSYIQLSELFSEQEKLFARQMALAKRQKKRPDYK